MKSSSITSILLVSLSSLVGSASSFGQNKSGVPIPPVAAFTTTDTAIHGRQIAEYVDRYDRGWKDEVSRGEMTLYDADGDSVRRAFTRLSLERIGKGDKFITKFLSPAEIKGVAALTHENPGSSDDNWLYLPANKRVRRISGANNTASFQGTEFTYEDLASIDPGEYRWRFVRATKVTVAGTEHPVFELAATPTYKNTGYSRLTLFVHRKHWRQERIDYFDKTGRKLKSMESSKWLHQHGRFWRARRIKMTNHQTGRRTTLAQEKYFTNLALYKSRSGKPRKNLPESAFTTRALQK